MEPVNPPSGLVAGEDGRLRCWWGAEPSIYRAYHDEEWGRPVTEDFRLFEKICLEGFQSGLSWLTILKKREAFRSAFVGFDFHKVSSFGDDDVERLIKDAGIIRHRGKIVSTIHNARLAVALASEEGSLADFFWRFVPSPSERPATIDRASMASLATTPASIRLSRELKKRGWTYVGPTTCYAFMQAMGLVNDHLEGCHVRPLVGGLPAQG